MRVLILRLSSLDRHAWGRVPANGGEGGCSRLRGEGSLGRPDVRWEDKKVGTETYVRMRQLC